MEYFIGKCERVVHGAVTRSSCRGIYDRDVRASMSVPNARDGDGGFCDIGGNNYHSVP